MPTLRRRAQRAADTAAELAQDLSDTIAENPGRVTALLLVGTVTMWGVAYVIASRQKRTAATASTTSNGDGPATPTGNNPTSPVQECASND